MDDNRRELGQPVDYEEIPLLFRNQAGKRFRLSTKDVGPYFDTPHVGRGAAFGDLDNDGDIDIVVNEKDRPAAVLRNDTPTKNHWIRLILQGTRSNRDAIGTRIEVETGKTITDERDGKLKEWKIFRQRKGGVSLESANDPRLLIGVGDVTELKKVTIRWPSGIVTTLEKVKVDQTYPVVEPKDGVPEKKPGTEVRRSSSAHADRTTARAACRLLAAACQACGGRGAMRAVIQYSNLDRE